jgi:hypothetical protein
MINDHGVRRISTARISKATKFATRRIFVRATKIFIVHIHAIQKSPVSNLLVERSSDVPGMTRNLDSGRIGSFGVPITRLPTIHSEPSPRRVILNDRAPASLSVTEDR